MNKEEILNSIQGLSKSQGLYGSLYNKLSDKSEESEAYLEFLADQDFGDIVDLVMYIEEECGVG